MDGAQQVGILGLEQQLAPGGGGDASERHQSLDVAR
jgi:hypothetical protein